MGNDVDAVSIIDNDNGRVNLRWETPTKNAGIRLAWGSVFFLRSFDDPFIALFDVGENEIVGWKSLCRWFREKAKYWVSETQVQR